MASQQQASTTDPSKRDSWQTPQWLFDWANRRYSFQWDLAASIHNRKCDHHINIDDNALSIFWEDFDGFLWCNPPYSETGKWLKKAWESARKGARVAMLVPTPNGENSYRNYVFGKASEIIFINGRIGFELPNDDGTATPVNGNTRGSCLVVYNRGYEGQTLISWVDRDEMKSGG